MPSDGPWHKWCCRHPGVYVASANSPCWPGEFREGSCAVDWWLVFVSPKKMIEENGDFLSTCDFQKRHFEVHTRDGWKYQIEVIY